MRGAKVVFCRERNKYVKIQILGGGGNISVFRIAVAGTLKAQQLRVVRVESPLVQ